MLFVIHCANHPQLSYRGGQGPIVLLEADLNLASLGDIDWHAIASTNLSNGWISPSGLFVKEGKQAEFLLEGGFPRSLVQHVVVASPAVAAQALAALSNAAHRPPVSVDPTWYF